MSKSKEIIKKDNVIQAVLVADDFSDEFLPISNDTPLALLPLVNKPLIEYTLNFLAHAGVEETFLFCSKHVDAIKKYIQNARDNKIFWWQAMTVNVLVSESCRSFGDCLRDLDAKGLIRGTFVLAELGVVSNINLLPIIKRHIEVEKKDRDAAMTLIFQEAGVGHYSRNPQEEVVLASNINKRILFYKRLGETQERRINFPLDIFLENSKVSIRHDLKDTHVAICSPSVLPLFSDNFDYQTRSDFIKGLLMVDEVQDLRIYSHILKNSEHGGAVTNWRTYQAISRDLLSQCVNIQPLKRSMGKRLVLGSNCQVSPKASLSRSIIGDNVIIGPDAVIEDAFILSDVKVEGKCIVKHSVIGSKAVIKSSSKILNGSIIGEGVIINENMEIDNLLVQAEKPDFSMEADKLGDRAYRLTLDEETAGDELNFVPKFSRLRISDEPEVSDDEEIDVSDSEDDMSYTTSPVPDDTKLFFTEVIDSLARGYEDSLQCDNLILEINSSRYAYNVTLKEVNYNVIKAILNLPFQQSAGLSYLQASVRYLQFFSPILKNYIRGEDAMTDCLQAIEDVAAANNELNECVVKILNWLYDKDYLSEESIINWFGKFDKSTRLYAHLEPFIKWLQEAEEESSEEESD